MIGLTHCPSAVCAVAAGRVGASDAIRGGNGPLHCAEHTANLAEWWFCLIVALFCSSC